MNVVVICNTKGGVGKTTLTTALAVRALHDGAKVAMVDLDPQQSLAAWWQRRGGPDDLTIIGDVETASEGLAKLKRSGADWVFVDTPPAFLTVLEDAIASATFVLVPVKASVLDILASQDAIVLCRDAGAAFAVVVNDAAHTDAKFVESARSTLLKNKIPLCKTVMVHRSSHIAGATVGKSAAEVNAGRDTKAAEEIDSLWSEVKAGVRKAVKAREAANG